MAVARDDQGRTHDRKHAAEYREPCRGCNALAGSVVSGKECDKIEDCTGHGDFAGAPIGRDAHDFFLEVQQKSSTFSDVPSRPFLILLYLFVLMQKIILCVKRNFLHFNSIC